MKKFSAYLVKFLSKIYFGGKIKRNTTLLADLFGLLCFDQLGTDQHYQISLQHIGTIFFSEVITQISKS